jgi:hypothetical protein
MTALHSWNSGDQLNASDINANFLEVAKTGRITTLIAGEALSDKDAVAVGDGSQVTVNPETNASAHGPALSSSAWSAMSFTTPATDIASVLSISTDINNLTSASSSGTFTLELQTDNAGSPSGTALGSGSTGSLSFSNGEVKPVTLTFGAPVAVSPATKYWIVLKCTVTSGSGFAMQFGTGTTNKGKDTTNSGSSWSTATQDYMAGYTYVVATLGQVYRASSLANNYRFKNWIGFNSGACAAGAAPVVLIGGIADILTGLTQGTYYLSDTNGSIGTAAGTNSKKVGLAISATQLLIKHDNA